MNKTSAGTVYIYFAYWWGLVVVPPKSVSSG